MVKYRRSSKTAVLRSNNGDFRPEQDLLTILVVFSLESIDGASGNVLRQWNNFFPRIFLFFFNLKKNKKMLIFPKLEKRSYKAILKLKFDTYFSKWPKKILNAVFQTFHFLASVHFPYLVWYGMVQNRRYLNIL